MGKKSLFESTSEPGKKTRSRKAITEDKAVAGETPSTEAQKTASAVPPQSDDLARPVKETATAAPATDSGTPGEPGQPLPSKTPAEKKTARPVKKKASPAAETHLIREIETPEPTGSEWDASFQNQPLSDFDSTDMGGTYLKTAIAIVGGLLLLLCVASLLNSGSYYVRETKGAVEIWRGTFSPAGKVRMMVLHGAEWDKPVKTAYSRETVYAFASGFFIEKALALSDATGPVDYERIQSCLNQAQEMLTTIREKDAVNIIDRVRTYLTEAAILDNSGEKEAMALAEKRLQTARHALSGLLVEKVAEGEAAVKTP